jgi:hypothetical protein
MGGSTSRLGLRPSLQVHLSISDIKIYQVRHTVRVDEYLGSIRVRLAVSVRAVWHLPLEW